MIQPEDLLDRLFKAHLADKIDCLPSDEQKILKRMEYADELIRSGGKFMSYKNLVKQMAVKFKADEVTKRTLENDIARAKRFFLSRYKREDKEYARGVRVEWLDRLAAKAEKAGDFKASVAAIKEGNEVLSLKKDDPNLPNYEDLQPPPILIVSNPADIGVPVIDNLEEEIRILNLPKASAMKYADEDIEHEDLPNE